MTEEYCKSAYKELPIAPSIPWKETPVGEKKYRRRTFIAIGITFVGGMIWGLPLGAFSSIGFFIFVIGTIAILVNCEKYWNPKRQKKDETSLD